MTLDQLSNLVKDPKLFGILIVRPFGLLLQWLYSIVQNYGIAVIVFALLVKMLSRRSTPSFNATALELPYVSVRSLVSQLMVFSFGMTSTCTDLSAYAPWKALLS